MFKVFKEEIELDGKKIVLETGKIARQADGAIIATCGETVVISTVVGAKKAKEEIGKINQADSMIFQTEKQLKEYGEKLPADSKKSIEDALSELKKAHESKDLEGIDKAMGKMNTIWHTAGRFLE